jgi:hypothetical protein
MVGALREVQAPGTMGNERSRAPVASKVAFAIAGARPIIGHSPAPAEGRSLRSSKTVSMKERSLKRGTRYCDILPFSRTEEVTLA